MSNFSHSQRERKQSSGRSFTSEEIPEKILERMNMQRVRIYFQGQNLLTFKSKTFTGTDPENPNYAFPIPASYSIGLDLTL